MSMMFRVIVRYLSRRLANQSTAKWWTCMCGAESVLVTRFTFILHLRIGSVYATTIAVMLSA